MARNKFDNTTSGRKMVMVTGYAPAPRGTAMHQQFGYAGVAFEIDLDTDVIIDAEFTYVTRLAKNFFARLVQGYDLNTGTEPLCDEIRAKCWAPSTEAIVACVKIALQRYWDTKGKM